MKKQVNKSRDVIFIVTQERACPLYNVGQEIKVENFSLSVSAYKPGCLHLSQEVIKLVTSRDSFGGFSKFANQKAIFALLAIKKGHFTYTKGIPGVQENLPVIGDFMAVLMEGLQRIDELEN